LSYDFRNNKTTFKDIILSKNIQIDLNNEEDVNKIKNIDLFEEFEILAEVIDSNKLYKERLFQIRDFRNRYTNILLCKN